MMQYSYERVLSAVGRVLDETDARGFAIHEEGEGLFIETLDDEGKQEFALNFGLADLVELIEWKSRQDDAPHYERSYAHDDSTLLHFLERHTLVSAGR